MKRFFLLFSFFAIPAITHAQEQVRVGDVLDLEERIMVKKMTDELSKPNPNAPPPVPIVIAPPAQKIVYPTETLAVYGTSATFYEGQLSMGGRTYTVRNGTPVQGYTVTAVTPHGIELSKLVAPKKSGKKQSAAEPQKMIVFAPLAAH
ncbi:hypothetical protein [Massilia sp. erpn]|uniref:hypothetical protein n=1 Tax=Massilia sp. erpn TaxID=2738142 RepID=UPI002102BDD0|nr:hypothetical protein [Massilia sp. erpn]UTY55861.1 hypothetical protein HPQ68_00870 [Massilia sp. erpn]